MIFSGIKLLVMYNTLFVLSLLLFLDFVRLQDVESPSTEISKNGAPSYAYKASELLIDARLMNTYAPLSINVQEEIILGQLDKYGRITIDIQWAGDMNLTGLAIDASEDGEDSVEEDEMTQIEERKSFNDMQICPNNPPLHKDEGYGKSICQMWTQIRDRSFSRCSAWFVKKNRLITAGHCVWYGGRYLIDNGLEHYVCCNVDGRFSCKTGALFRIIQAVTTNGYVQGKQPFDGAVIKVAPYANTNTERYGKLASYGSARVSDMNLLRKFYWTGFPLRDRRFEGCDTFNSENKRWFSQTQQRPKNHPICNRMDKGCYIGLLGNGCGGMSGGMLYDHHLEKFVGIVSRGHPAITTCTNGLSDIYFTQICAMRDDCSMGGMNADNLLSVLR